MHQRSHRSDEPRGEALGAELKWVHDMIRRDLRTADTLRTWTGWPHQTGRRPR